MKVLSARDLAAVLKRVRLALAEGQMGSPYVEVHRTRRQAEQLEAWLSLEEERRK